MVCMWQLAFGSDQLHPKTFPATKHFIRQQKNKQPTPKKNCIKSPGLTVFPAMSKDASQLLLNCHDGPVCVCALLFNAIDKQMTRTHKSTN